MGRPSGRMPVSLEGKEDRSLSKAKAKLDNYDAARLTVQHGLTLRFLEEVTGLRAKALLRDQEIAVLTTALDAAEAERASNAKELQRLAGVVVDLEGVRADLASARSHLQTLGEGKETLERTVGSQSESITDLETNLRTALDAAGEFEKSANTNGGRVDAALKLLESMPSGRRFTVAMRKQLIDALTGAGEKAVAETA